MSGTPPPDRPPPSSTPPPPPTQPPQPPEGSNQPPQPAQPRPPQIPPQIWAQLLSGGVRAVPPLGPGGPIPVFLPIQAGQLSQTQTVQLWQGQYPPPEAVEHYEKILPGSFDRMISMAERLQAAQIEESRRAHEYTHSDNKRGHYLGFSAAVIAMGFALGALALGNPWVAAAFISVPVMGVARALIESAKKSSPADLLAAATNQPSEVPVPTPPPSPPPPP